MIDDSQERTEQATPKKEKESKERGLVARSKDFNSFVVLFFGCVSFIVFGKYIMLKTQLLFKQFFSFDAQNLQDSGSMLVNLKMGFVSGFYILLPVAILILVASLVGSYLMGGWSFSWGNVAPKFERLDPIKGLARIVSLKGVMELVKSILKVSLVFIAMFVIYAVFFKRIVGLGLFELNNGLSVAGNIMIYSFFILVCSLIVVCMFDVPFQIWDFRRQLMMTKQEVRDEYKETEGKPEVKSKLRSMQREMAARRMMEEIPKADVIITNPTHYAVALKYDEGKMKAPIVIAKGADNIAMKIIELGKKHSIPTISAPPLARSIFFHTEIGAAIPQKLYVAVAQVLAYIHQLKQYRRGKMKRPKLPTKYDIPTDMIK